MPTSPRDLTGGIGGYKRTALLSNLRDDEGIVPYASKGATVSAGVEGTPTAEERTRFLRKAGSPHPSGLRPATFPVGEGILRRGSCSSGPVLDFQGSPPHPSRLRRATLSKQERAYLSSQAR